MKKLFNKYPPIKDNFVILVIVSCLLNTILVQKLSASELFIFDRFDGGLNTKLSNFNLPKNQGDIVENVRFDENLTSLTKRDKTIIYGTADEEEAITGLYRLYLNDGTKTVIVTHGNELEIGDDSTGEFTKILDLTTSDYRWQFLTWHNVLIGCDGVNNCIKYDGSSGSATYLGAVLATDADDGAGPDGSYLYKATCYSTSYEISLDTASNPITVSDNDIDLTMIPICPDTILGEDVIGRKIYRTEAGGATYKILSNGDISDNTTVTLTDSDADGALGVALSPDYTYPPPKGKYLLVHKNRLWLANNLTTPSRIYYSEDASYDYFLPAAYFNIRPDDGDEITFIKNLLGILTISKNNTIQKLRTDGDSPTADWEISDPFSFIGCQSPYSAINTAMGVIYLGNNGIYIFDGQFSQLISDAVKPEIQDILPSNYPNAWGAYYKNKYYLAYTSFSTGAASNNRILIYDFLSNVYSIDTLSRNTFHVFNSGSDIEALFSGSSTDGKIYAHTDTVKELIHKRHADFTGTWDDMRYIPEEVGGDPESPVLEIARTETIDELAGTVDSLTGVIDRADSDGSYISQYLTINASSFDKLYWNESIPSEGGDVTFALRAGATTTDTLATDWSSEFSISTGSDVSEVTADTVAQYRISATTDSITVTPNVLYQDNYVIRLTYNTSGGTDETTIPVKWRSGWLDLGAPDRVKELEKIYVYYETDTDSSEIITITVDNFEGDSDSFEIDYFTYPKRYIEYFTGGKFVGNLFRLTIEENSLNDIVIKKIVIRYKTQGENFEFP